VIPPVNSRVFNVVCNTCGRTNSVTAPPQQIPQHHVAVAAISTTFVPLGPTYLDFSDPNSAQYAHAPAITTASYGGGSGATVTQKQSGKAHTASRIIVLGVDSSYLAAFASACKHISNFSTGHGLNCFFRHARTCVTIDIHWYPQALSQI
jgi:hypothetical protein